LAGVLDRRACALLREDEEKKIIMIPDADHRYV